MKITLKRKIKSKIPFTSYPLILKLFKYLIKKQEKSSLHSFSKACTILPKMIGFVIYVYNGKTKIPVYIKPNMVGCKLGEFIFTRRAGIHTRITKNFKKQKPKVQTQKK